MIPASLKTSWEVVLLKHKTFIKIFLLLLLVFVISTNCIVVFADEYTEINNGIQYRTSYLEFDDCMVSYGSGYLFMGSPLKWPTGSSSVSPALNQTETHTVSGHTYTFDRYLNSVNKDFWFKGTVPNNQVIIQFSANDTLIQYNDLFKLSDSLYIMSSETSGVSVSCTLSCTIHKGTLSRDYSYYDEPLNNSGNLGFTSTEIRYSETFTPSVNNRNYDLIPSGFVDELLDAFTINWYDNGVFYRTDSSASMSPLSYIRISDLVLRVTMSTTNTNWEFNVNGLSRDSYDLQSGYTFSEGLGLSAFSESFDTGTFGLLAPLFSAVGSFFDIHIFGEFTLGHVGLIAVAVGIFGVVRWFMHT